MSHTVILEPLKPGTYNFTSAQVAYKASEDATEPQVNFHEISFKKYYVSEVRIRSYPTWISLSMLQTSRGLSLKRN